MKRRAIRVGTTLFVIVNVGLLLAPFIAPFSPTEQHRDLAYAPPSHLHFVDGHARIHLRPFVYGLKANDSGESQYVEDTGRPFPIRFFQNKNGGLHLFSVESGANVFLLGTDGFGRDVFSRLLFGARISLAAALLATILSLAIGAGLGAMAGYFGGIVDALVMRGSELALALPWLYLLLAIRAVLPLHIPPTQTFLLISGVIGVVGWARPARLIRGVVLSERERPFVSAARGFGASEWYLLRCHVLPQTAGIVITQAVVLIPQFILAEATLSFLGLGLSEPLPSLGNMLSAFQQFQVMSSYWWMAAPLGALVILSATYFAVADALHGRIARLEPRGQYA